MTDIGREFDFCPVCGETFSVGELNAHANSHFTSPRGSPRAAPDPVRIEAGPSEVVELTVELEYVDERRLPTIARQLVVVQTIDAQFLPEVDSLRDLEWAIQSRRPVNHSQSTFCISGPVQHFCAMGQDRGWGCGYRNCQMLISHLISRGAPYRAALFGGAGFVPDILSLQAWLECTWGQGYDLVGRHSLKGSVQGSNKWVGAADIAALLRQFGVRAQFVDFVGQHSRHHPNYEGGTVHEGCTCDLCSAQPIVGRRHTSQTLSEFDLCDHCVQSEAALEFAPYDIYGQPEIHLGSACMECGMRPIVGVCYQKIRSWRETLCQHCFQERDALHQSPFRPRLESRNKRSFESSHENLMQWVWEYFSQDLSLEQEEEMPIRYLRTDKAPLLFQHHGHSRTIVGIERVKTEGRHAATSYNLLILDPSTRAETLQQSFQKGRGQWQSLMKRGLHTLRHPEFQILYVEPGIASEEERQQLKHIKAKHQVLS